MKQKLPWQTPKEPVDEILGRSNHKENELFGLPWRFAISLIYSAGFLFGAIPIRAIALGFCPTVRQGEIGQEHFVYTLGNVGFLIVVVVTLLIIVVAFIGQLEETWHRLGVLAVAGGLLISGFWTLVIHKIELHPDRFVIRGPLSPMSTTYSLTDGNRIVTRVQERSPSVWGWTRRKRHLYSVHYIRSDGSETVLYDGRGGPPTWARVAS